MPIRSFALGFAGLALVALAGCNESNSAGLGNGGNLDPNNPPDSPFPDDSFPDDGICADINVVVDGLTPTVQLLIDQSGSMESSFARGVDRWEAVYNTLMGGGGVVQRFQSSVEFGLSLYTSNGGNAGGQCPMVSSVTAGLDNFAAIDAVYGPSGPEGDTPTGESIDAVAAQLAMRAGPGRKILVLGTDGEPDTCAEPDQNTPARVQAARDLAIAAATRAFAAGIRMFVVSVGDQVGLDHLQDMANAGAGLPVGGPTNEEFFVALQPDDLVNAFSSIVGSASGCVFTMNGTVDPSKASEGLVALDGETLQYGSDWQLVDSGSFELLGAACDTIRDGDLHHVSAVFPCGAIIIDIE